MDVSRTRTRDGGTCMNGHSTKAGPADGGRAVTAGSERTPAGPNAHPACKRHMRRTWTPGLTSRTCPASASAPRRRPPPRRKSRTACIELIVPAGVTAGCGCTWASGRWVASTNRQVRHVGIRSLTVSGLSGGIPERQRPAAAAGATRPEAGGAGAAAGAWCW
jgi:hypothetical protein